MMAFVNDYVTRYNELAEIKGFPSISESEFMQRDWHKDDFEFFRQIDGKYMAESDLFYAGMVTEDDCLYFSGI